MVSTSLTIGTSEATKMLRAKVSNAKVMLDGAPTTENEADRPIVSTLKGVGLNFVVIPSEVLHLL